MRPSPTPSAPASRKRLAILASAALVLSGAATVSVLSTAAGAATVNLLTNPGFETAGLSGWTCDASTGSAGATPSASATSSSTPSSTPTTSSSPTSSPTPTSTGTGTSTGTSGAWTHPVYWMPLDNAPQSISSIISGSGEKEFNLSFVLDSGGCTPAWDGSAGELVSNDTAVLADVNAIRAAGGDVAVTFGGYNGTELGTTCGSASALASAYQQVISKYKLTRVDFDYENGALDSNTAVRFGAIKILERNNPNLVASLTIPMTTVGFPGSGTDEIRQAIANGARLDVINIMAFDTGLTSGTEEAQTE